jgi:hypothetical protein
MPLVSSIVSLVADIASLANSIASSMDVLNSRGTWTVRFYPTDKEIPSELEASAEIGLIPDSLLRSLIISSAL